MKDSTWIWIIGGAAILYYLYQKQQAAAATVPAATAPAVQYMPGTQGIPVMPGWAGATGGR